MHIIVLVHKRMRRITQCSRLITQLVKPHRIVQFLLKKVLLDSILVLEIHITCELMLIQYVDLSVVTHVTTKLYRNVFHSKWLH